jgi:MFS transporter, ACS family, pantothenate transporter
MKCVFARDIPPGSLLRDPDRFDVRSMWNNVINAWWQLILYPATDAPRFRKGMIAMIAVCVATLLVTWLVWYLERREVRIREARDGVEPTASEPEPLSPTAEEKAPRSGDRL